MGNEENFFILDNRGVVWNTRKMAVYFREFLNFLKFQDLQILHWKLLLIFNINFVQLEEVELWKSRIQFCFVTVRKNKKISYRENPGIKFFFFYFSSFLLRWTRIFISIFFILCRNESTSAHSLLNYFHISLRHFANSMTCALHNYGFSNIIIVQSSILFLSAPSAECYSG